MRITLIITALAGMAMALPSDLSAMTKRGTNCDDCKARFDNCMELSTAQGTWCELVCKKFTCKLDAACYDCKDRNNNPTYNCTILNQVPTFRVPEDEDPKKEDPKPEEPKKGSKKGKIQQDIRRHGAATEDKFDPINLPTFVAPVVMDKLPSAVTDADAMCPESFTCDKEGETVLRCLCGFCSVAPGGYCVPKGQVCRVIKGKGQCVKH